MPFGLPDHTIEKINSVFNQFPEVEEAILYGSRAKGTYKHGSDIDLTLIGLNLDSNIRDKISWNLDDLLLPYSIDLSVLNHIENKDLLNHIDRVGQLFYSKKRSYV